MATTLGVSTLDLLPRAIPVLCRNLRLDFLRLHGNRHCEGAISDRNRKKYYGNRIGEHVMDFNKIIDRQPIPPAEMGFYGAIFRRG